MNLQQLIANPNYLLCVMWRDTLGNVHRYALWRGVGELIGFNLPLYAGQVIGKNFRFEIWSVQGSSTASLTVSSKSDTDNNGTYEFVVTTTPTYKNTINNRYISWNNNGTSLTNQWYLVVGLTSSVVEAISDTPDIQGAWNSSGYPYDLTVTLADQAQQTTPIQMYTSVLGNLDYRFGTDFQLVPDDGQVIAFQSTFDLPLVFPPTSVPQPN